MATIYFRKPIGNNVKRVTGLLLSNEIVFDMKKANFVFPRKKDAELLHEYKIVVLKPRSQIEAMLFKDGLHVTGGGSIVIGAAKCIMERRR